MRQVLQILENMPERTGKRAGFLTTTVAISRRRIACDEDSSHFAPQEKKEQLLAAAEHIDFALNRIAESEDDDTR